MYQNFDVYNFPILYWVDWQKETVYRANANDDGAQLSAAELVVDTRLRRPLPV